MICYYCHTLILNAPKHGLHKKCFQNWFELSSQNTEFTSLALKKQIQLQRKDHCISSSFFAGAFKKYSALLADKEYILKVATSEFPELPQTEYLSNQIAKTLNLPIPKFYLIKLENEVDCFVSYNFMQNYQKANLVHIFHYFSQDTTEEDYCCRNLLKIIEVQTKQYNDVINFMKTCIFDALIGNHDRHGRNLALIETTNKINLSPIYDNPSYIGLEENALLGATHEPYGKIQTNNTNPTMKDYVLEFKLLGFREELIKFYKTINIERIKEIINNSFISEKRQAALIKIVNRRYQEGLNVL